MTNFAGPAEAPRMGLILNKRFIRIVFAALIALGLFVLTILWRDNVVVAILPRYGKPNAPEYYPFSTRSSFFPVSIDPTADKTADDLCASFPKHILNSIQPVLKMGHGEDRKKLEAQLDSVSACFGKEDLVIFSDLDETIRGHQVIDILADLPDSYYDFTTNPDFRHYVWQKEMRANGTLDKDVEATKRINGWRLDRFKFLPMVERAWAMKPNKDFYFFYETDTYVFWDNAFRFLQTLDPDTPLYMGSPSPGRVEPKKEIKTWFANGGPGFVLSRGAVKALLHREAAPNGQYIDPPVTEKWLPLIKPECCGDSVLGWALWNIDVPLSGYWPLFNPHNLHGIPFSDLYWCQPVLTLHKNEPADMVGLWRWEFGQRKLGHPLLYSDVWRFKHPGEPTVLENWDNAGWDDSVAPAQANVDSFEACEKICRGDGNCMQWNWRGKDKKECKLMRSIRYGRARQPEKYEIKKKKPEKKEGEEEKVDKSPPQEGWMDFKAGYVEDRIAWWKDQRNCSVVQWVGPSIKRVF